MFFFTQMSHLDSKVASIQDLNAFQLLGGSQAGDPSGVLDHQMSQVQHIFFMGIWLDIYGGFHKWLMHGCDMVIIYG